MPGPESIPPPRAPFAYPPRNRFRNDPDETEGRGLYRAYASAEAALAMALARRIRLSGDEG
jgi:hypothetical protein